MDQIRNNFSWGRIIDIICIGDEYQFIKSEYKLNAIKTIIAYHIYINYKSTGRYMKTLDRAIISAICSKYDGINQDVSYYIYKMLSMDKEEI